MTTEKENYCDADGWCTTIQHGEPHDGVCRHYERYSVDGENICKFDIWGNCTNKQARAEAEKEES